MNTLQRTPWYREPWPWLLMLGPVTVVIAGFITLYLAVTSFDGLVEDDYYKQGLGINRQIARDQTAHIRGVNAHLAFSEDLRQVRMVLRDQQGTPQPAELQLKLAHPTRAGLDQRLTLKNIGSGSYQGALDNLQPGRWSVTLEDPAKQWRVVGELMVPGGLSVDLQPAR